MLIFIILLFKQYTLDQCFFAFFLSFFFFFFFDCMSRGILVPGPQPRAVKTVES